MVLWEPFMLIAITSTGIISFLHFYYDVLKEPRSNIKLKESEQRLILRPTSQHRAKGEISTILVNTGEKGAIITSLNASVDSPLGGVDSDGENEQIPYGDGLKAEFYQLGHVTEGHRISPYEIYELKPTISVESKHRLIKLSKTQHVSLELSVVVEDHRESYTVSESIDAPIEEYTRE